MTKLKIIPLFLFICLISSVSANIVLESNIFTGWKTSFTGDENILFNLSSISNNKICISPNEVNLNPITKEECSIDGKECKNITYSYPADLLIKDGKTGSVLQAKDLFKDYKNGNICFDLNPLQSLFYRIGLHSIIIEGETSYSSSNINITQENGFTHLNLSDDIILYSPFNTNQSTTAYDYSNKSNNGVITNASWISDGIIGGAYTFNGNNSIINYSKPLIPGSSNFTLSFWMNHFSSSAIEGIVAQYVSSGSSRFAILINQNEAGGVYSENTLNIFGADGLAMSFNNVLPNLYYHVVIARNGSDVRLYLNGSLVDLDGGVGNILQTDFVLGRLPTLTPYFFNGTIDDVIIFNRTLNDTEIQSIYNNQSSRFFPKGQMLFTGLNFGTNNTANISIANCSTLNTSYIQASLNGTGFVNLSSCSANNLNIANPSDANLTLKLFSGDYNFYTPIIMGNITLDDWLIEEEEPPSVSANISNLPLACFNFMYDNPNIPNLDRGFCKNE